MLGTQEWSWWLLILRRSINGRTMEPAVDGKASLILG